MALEAEVGCAVGPRRIVAHVALMHSVHTAQRMRAVMAADAIGIPRAIGAEARLVAIVARVVVPAGDAEAILWVVAARRRPPAARGVAVLTGRGEARVSREGARVVVLAMAVHTGAGSASELGGAAGVARAALGGLMHAGEREGGMRKSGAGPGRGAMAAAAIVRKASVGGLRHRGESLLMAGAAGGRCPVVGGRIAVAVRARGGGVGAFQRPIVVREAGGAPAGVAVAGAAIGREALVRRLRDAVSVVLMAGRAVRGCSVIYGRGTAVAARAAGAGVRALQRPFVLEGGRLPGVRGVATAAFVRKVGVRGLADLIALVGVTRYAVRGGSAVYGRVSRVAGRAGCCRMRAFEWPGMVRAPRRLPAGVAVAVGAVLRQHADVQRLRSLLEVALVTGGAVFPHVDLDMRGRDLTADHPAERRSDTRQDHPHRELLIGSHCLHSAACTHIARGSDSSRTRQDQAGLPRKPDRLAQASQRGSGFSEIFAAPAWFPVAAGTRPDAPHAES